MLQNRIWTKDFILLIISLLLISCANYFFASSMAVYALTVNAAAYAGILTAAFYFGSVGMRLVNGMMVQKYGARRLMLISAAVCAAACFAHSSVAAISVLIVLRVLHGMGYSIFSTASNTAASYIVPRSRLGEGMGYFTFGNVLALALGPSIALTVVAGNTVREFHELFYIAAAISAVALFMSMFVAKDKTTDRQADTISDATAAELPKTFLGFEKGVILPSLICFLMTFAYSPMFVYLAEYGLVRHFGNMGAAFSLYAVGLFSARLFTGRLSDRHGPDCVMIPAYFCGMAALCAAAFCTARWHLLATMLILGLCIGTYNPQINVFCITRCSKEHRGTATAAFNGAGDLGLALGSAVNGLLITSFGFRFTFLSGGVICFATLIIYILSLSSFAGKKSA